jgi:hypothetical protein
LSRFLDKLSVSPLPDGLQWEIGSDFRYTSPAHGLITVPGPTPTEGGFITDFASVPKPLQLKFPPWQRYGAAAILHDWLYFDQSTTFDAANDVLLEAMTLLGVPAQDAKEIYEGVHLFGQGAWRRNAELKANRYTRRASLAATPPYAQVAL